MKAKVVYKNKATEERDMHPTKLAELSKMSNVAAVVTYETSKLQTVYIDGLLTQYDPVTCKFV
jgi:hypothetical protein